MWLSLVEHRVRDAGTKNGMSLEDQRVRFFLP
jgi:hypothetical protein